ncbi:glutathione S-transferase family protein [Aquabacter sp. CN5-332]|uniref:glutathione S-transferase family protein n=1 Tax=Aquabacter sp. CN5-332 TaxID=3156608 RepID=UPI0032B5A7CB
MITVHHLDFSRSHRVLWLLEEFGLTYELVRYKRDANFKAPPALAAIHPLGKSPVIQDGALTLAESAVILEYINTRYGGGRLAPPPGSDAYFVHEEWLQFVESTAAFPIMMTRIGALTGGLSERMAQFVSPVLQKTLDYISSAVSTGAYLSGDRFQLADIQMAYPLEIASYGGMLGAYPQLTEYLDRLKARPAFERAVEKGGPMMPPK